MRVLVVLCLTVAVAAASDVLEFTDDDFQESVNPHEVILIEFFAPWCVSFFISALCMNFVWRGRGSI